MNKIDQLKYALEKSMLTNALLRARGNVRQAAKDLDMAYSTIYQKMHRCGIDPQEIKAQVRAMVDKALDEAIKENKERDEEGDK